MTIREAYAFFVTNDGIRYFASQPSRLLMVAAISIIGGSLALAISRLTPFARRGLTLLTLGIVAALASCVLGLLAVSLLSFSSMITDAGTWPLVLVAFLSVSGGVFLLWFEFFRVLRRDENPVS